MIGDGQTANYSAIVKYQKSQCRIVNNQRGFKEFYNRDQNYLLNGLGSTKLL